MSGQEITLVADSNREHGPQKLERLDFLDSLRGLAACLVVLHHVYQTDPFWPDAFRFSPLRMVLNARTSVIFFFVLSGFVLAYGIWRGDQPVRFFRFALRRLTRIYLPFAAAGLAAIVSMILLNPGPLPGMGIVFNEMWRSPITWSAALAHLGLVGSVEAVSVNTPSWSLVYEIRISLLIPLFCLLASRFRTGFIAASVVIFILNEFAMNSLGLSRVPYTAATLTDNLLVTTHFAASFILGLLLARAAVDRADWLYRMSPAVKCLLAFVAAPLLLIFRDETASIGSALIMVLALNTKGFQNFLRSPILLFLGRISFSLYLTHFIVLQIVVRTLYDFVPLWLSLTMVLIGAIPCAVIFYYAVERPALQLSKRIGRWGN
jgi:peptidoglycan/LPS O-acetylase OafA/YrhL